MPFFKIETNHPPNDIDTMMKKASGFIANLLNKPEHYVMISIETDPQMMFGGTMGPTAFVQLKSIGLPMDKCAAFSEKICRFINNEIGVPPDRVFIDFTNLKRNMFGWNGNTF